MSHSKRYVVEFSDSRARPDAFQKFAHPEITQTLVIYLSRYEEFTSADQVKRIVNLMHRQAVKAKAEGLFFNVSTLSLFRSILEREKRGELGKEREWRDLVNLVGYVVRRFWKGVQEDAFLVVEVRSSFLTFKTYL